MNKKLLNALLCGAAILSMSVFNSCKTDTSDLDTRVRVLEEAWADLQASLGKAVTDGLYIIADQSGYNADGSIYNLVFSNGSSVQVPISEGTQVAVEIKDGVAVITVNGEAYEIPLGAAVSSFWFVDEYGDRIVELGNNGANVKFLATPALTADVLATAEFSFADITQTKQRTRIGDTGEIIVTGKGTLDGGYISVPIKGISCMASQSYTVSIQMSVSGTVLSSDYFIIKVSDDFSFKDVDIDANIKVKESFNPTLNEDGSYKVTIDGMALLEEYDFAAMFDGVPADAKFQVASSAKQPGGDAQKFQANLNSNLSADGKWDIVARPGSAFADTGFLINVTKDYVAKAQLYVSIIDPLADVDWSGGLTGNGEAEWGARWKGLAVGVNELDLQPSFFSVANDGDATADWEIMFGNARGGFFEKWPDFIINHGTETLIFNNGERLEVTPEGAKYTKGSAGIYWWNRNLVIRVPEEAGAGGERWPNFMGHDGQEHGPGWSPVDVWANSPDMTPTNNNLAVGVEYGITVTKDGVLKTTSAYGGYCFRTAIGANFEYAFGMKKLGVGDQFSMFFWNRRWFPAEGTFFPANLMQ